MSDSKFKKFAKRLKAKKLVETMPGFFGLPIWQKLRPYAHISSSVQGGRVAPRLDFQLPADLRQEAIAVTTLCVSCGLAIHPLRARKKSGRSRVAGSETEWRLFYAATCTYKTNDGCGRSTASQNHTKWLTRALDNGLLKNEET
jgi:hypothetical protein